MSAKNTIAKIWNNIQYNLFPFLEQEIGELSPIHKKLVAILELIRIEEFIPSWKFINGRPPKDILAIARANIAKIVFKITYTNQLIRVLKSDKQLQLICGFDVFTHLPSESKFSRAFSKFAKLSLPEKVHQALVKEIYKDDLLQNVVIDSTPVEAREKVVKKELKRAERKRKLDRERAKAKRHGELNRRQIQLKEEECVSVAKLPKVCDRGMKRSSQGYTMIWKGYKLHVAINEDCVPLAAILTSASLNDCEVAIPLMKKSHKVALNLYNIMDAAYDHPEIRQAAISDGRIPIIDKCPHNPAQKEEKNAEMATKRKLNLWTAEDRRYKSRFSKERFNALYKDFNGGRNIFFKGYEKVNCHVMFGILTTTASTLLNLIT
jgi:Transposase DDE domain/Transposase domain (DUF772)